MSQFLMINHFAMETTHTEDGKFKISLKDGCSDYRIVVKTRKFWISSNPGGIKQLGRYPAE